MLSLPVGDSETQKYYNFFKKHPPFFFFLRLRRTTFPKNVGGVELTGGFHTFENDPIVELTGVLS